jgi:hypothetical protein
MLLKSIARIECGEAFLGRGVEEFEVGRDEDYLVVAR